MEYDAISQLRESDVRNGPSSLPTTLCLTEGKATMSIKVQSLATEIYKELEALVSVYGNKFLHSLMPLVVSALENLDMLHSEKQNIQLNLAVLQEDRRHLLEQYERERSLRKVSESKLLHMEDEFEEERKCIGTEYSQLEAASRVLETKLKNLNEKQEREQQLMKDCQCLHERYAYLFRNFAEFTEKSMKLPDNPVPIERQRMIPSDLAVPLESFGNQDPPNGRNISTSPFMLSHAYRIAHPTAYMFDSYNHSNLSQYDRQQIMQNILETTPELHDEPSTTPQQLPDPNFDELSQGDLFSEDGQESKSVDGSYCAPQGNAGDSCSLDMFNGVTKEVNNLIKENQDLIQTKNALNVVTNDLISRIDDLTCENVRVSTERNALVSNSTGMLIRIKDLERECRRLRHELESVDMQGSTCFSDVIHTDDSSDDELDDDDDKAPLSMRKRFTHVEMTRVLLERNYYKEQLIDLQDAVRLTETLRVEQRYRVGSRNGPRRRSRMWHFFQNLFTPTKADGRSNTVVFERSKHTTSTTTPPAADPLGGNHTDDSDRQMYQSLSTTTQNGYRKMSETMRSRLDYVPCLNPPWMRGLSASDEWIGLVGFEDRETTSIAKSTTQASWWPFVTRIRPLCESAPGLKLWSATVTLNTLTTDSILPSYTSRSSVTDDTGGSDSAPSEPVPLINLANRPRRDSQRIANETPSRPIPDPMPILWTCSIRTGAIRRTTDPPALPFGPSFAKVPTIQSLITILDVNRTDRNLDAFTISNSTVLCLSSVPGNSTQTIAHLRRTTSYWDGVPVSLSEELSPEQPRNSPPPPLSGGSHLSRSLYWSSHTIASMPTVPSVLTTTTPMLQCRHPSLIEFGRSRHSHWALPGLSQTNSPTGSVYFVERRQFHPRTSASHLPRQDRSALEHQLRDFLPARTELPSSTTNTAPPDSTLTSAQPTVWIGCHNGDLFVHSALSDWRQCLHAVRLPDSVTHICHDRGRVFVNLANSQLVVFRRRLPSTSSPPAATPASGQSSPSTSYPVGHVTSSNLPDRGDAPWGSLDSPIHTRSTTSSSGDHVAPGASKNTSCSRDGAWDFSDACVVTYDQVRSIVRASIMVTASETLWVACQNRIVVIDTASLQLVHRFACGTQLEGSINQLTAHGLGVWVAMRRSTKLSLYHVHTQHLLQTVDVGPVLNKQLGLLSSTGSVVGQGEHKQISLTSILATESLLWLGTNVGLVATVPFQRLDSDEDKTELHDDATSSIVGAQTSLIDVNELKVSRHQHHRSTRVLLHIPGVGPTISDAVKREDKPGGKSEQQQQQQQSLEHSLSSELDVKHENGQARVDHVVCGGQGYRYVEKMNTLKSNHSTNGSHLLLWDTTGI